MHNSRTIPIVFTSAADPVAIGLVPNLNQPGGNITGFAGYEPSLAGKWLELLSEIAPGLKRAAIMFDPESASASVYVASFETAARSLKVMPISTPVHGDGEIETAIVALGREPGGGLVVLPDAFTGVHRASVGAERGNKDVRLSCVAGQRIDHRNRVAGEIHEQLFARHVRLAQAPR
jgi:putative ABC transport system substrate-binding protein